MNGDIDTETKTKTPWKYRLAYIFMVAILTNWVPEGTVWLAIIGAIIIYPFFMSPLSRSNADFFKRERTYLREEWKSLPVWGKAFGIAIALSLSTGPVGLSRVGDIISLALTFWIMWFIYTTVSGYARKGASHVKDMAEDHFSEQ